MTTLDKEKLFLGEQITEKDQTLSSSQKDDIVQSNKEFFEKYPSDYVKSLVENKLSQSTSYKKGSFTIKPSFVLKLGAIAAILVMAFVLPLSIVNSSKVYESVFPGADQIRVKGKSSTLFVYRNENGKAVRLSNGTMVQEGDILQLSYVCSSPKQALIVSVDGNGIVTPHFPEDSTDSSLLERGGEHPLSYSYVLDDAPSFERFYLVTCDEEFSLDSIEDFLLSISGISGKIDVEELSDLVGSKVSISDIMLLK